MKCLSCEKEFDSSKIKSNFLCFKCFVNYSDNPESRNDILEIIVKKKKQIAKYRQENIQNPTKACRKAKKEMIKILSPFKIKHESERIFFPYIVDFYIRHFKLAIEIDGEIHEKQIEYDYNRDKFIRANYKVDVIRIKNEDVFTDYFKRILIAYSIIYIREQAEKLNEIAINNGIPERIVLA